MGPSRLAQTRKRRRLTQAQLASRTGLSVPTIQRLEARQTYNPPIRNLVNCAIVLRVPLEEIVEPEWLEWTVFSPEAIEPPEAP